MTELIPYTSPSNSELEQLWQLASKLARTEFVAKPMRGSPEAVLACILTGRELGIGPMQALRDIYLVNGRPGMAATLMVARVRARGHQFRTLENTDHQATVQIHRAGEATPEPPVTFTVEDAKRAKLVSKDVWQQYPARMLWARAASACCRRDCPEALGGTVYTPEELEDTDVAWGEAEVEVEESAAGVVTTPPTPAVAATGTIPTLDQIKRVGRPEDADRLIRQAGEEFGELVSQAVLAMRSTVLRTRDQARGWWVLASVKDRRDMLEHAVELAEQRQHETSAAGSVPPPAAGTQSDPVPGTKGKGVGPGPDEPHEDQVP